MNNKVYYCPECGEKFIASESLGFCPRCGVKIRTFKGGEKEISIQGENADDVKKVADYALSNSDERNEIKLSAPWGCLLYTSDAADEEDSVDLGGRRIIKK